ncbi:hypothetical protein HK102_010548 [Quaeritorhiza haematococci]|nr:hypothetical protein HK102_010548 [Quaeritorhiza haematococci]
MSLVCKTPVRRHNHEPTPSKLSKTSFKPVFGFKSWTSLTHIPKIVTKVSPPPVSKDQKDPQKVMYRAPWASPVSPVGSLAASFAAQTFFSNGGAYLDRWPAKAIQMPTHFGFHMHTEASLSFGGKSDAAGNLNSNAEKLADTQSKIPTQSIRSKVVQCADAEPDHEERVEVQQNIPIASANPHEPLQGPKSGNCVPDRTEVQPSDECSPFVSTTSTAESHEAQQKTQRRPRLWTPSERRSIQILVQMALNTADDRMEEDQDNEEKNVRSSEVECQFGRAGVCKADDRNDHDDEGQDDCEEGSREDFGLDQDDDEDAEEGSLPGSPAMSGLMTLMQTGLPDWGVNNSSHTADESSVGDRAPNSPVIPTRRSSLFFVGPTFYRNLQHEHLQHEHLSKDLRLSHGKIAAF